MNNGGIQSENAVQGDEKGRGCSCIVSCSRFSPATWTNVKSSSSFFYYSIENILFQVSIK